MKIGELARQAGCQTVTIRYYEREGLLGRPERTEGNYRVYSAEDLDRLRFIRHCRLHGMTLDEIRDLLAFRDHPRQDCAWINALVERHIREVDEQIASLQHLKGHLERLLHQCSGAQGGSCGILKGLREGTRCPSCDLFSRASAASRPKKGGSG